MAIREYKCANCGGAVSYDYGGQNIKCAHCGSAFEISEFEARQNPLGGSADNGGGGNIAGNIETVSAVWSDPSTDGMEHGVCPSCGAVLFRCKNAVAMVCPHCGNAEIALKRLAGMFKPDHVIPFKFGKDRAIAALKRFCKDKYLLPSDYLEEKRVNEMQGVYAPFWLFDAKVRGSALYSGARSKNSKNYDGSITRAGTLAFQKIPVDGSRRLDDDYMDAIEPFYYKGMLGFNTAYLAGYLAEKYDVSAEESKERAVKRIEGTFAEKLGESISGYADIRAESVNIEILEAAESYALFPIWIFNAKYQGENYKFMVNGQTGKLAGRLPVDGGKVKKYTALITSGYGALFTAVALVTLRPSVVKLFTEKDDFGSPLIQTLLRPLGYLIDFVSDFKILVIAALLGAAYMLAAGIIKKWKKRMNTIGLKKEAFDYSVRGSMNIADRWG